MGIAATLVARVLARFPWISYLGLLLIVWVAATMIWEGGWQVYGGTSVAAPLTAGIYGNNGGAVNYGQNPYSAAATLHDITSGHDGACGSYLCTARAGYDGPTGWGTPNGTGAFQATDHKVTVTAPGTRHSTRGKKIASLRVAARDSASARRLRARGLLDSGGRLTKTGGALRREVEDLTDRLAAGPVERLGSTGVERAIELATPVSRHLIDTGVMPVPNPIGLPRP